VWRIGEKEKARWLVELNNRETAMFIWAGIALIWMLMQTEVRGALWGVVRSFFQLKLLATLLPFLAWIVGSIWIADQIGLWEDSLVNEGVYWFVATGFVLYFSVTRLAQEKGFLRRTTRRVLTFSVLAEVFVNLIVLPLWIELWFFPLITVLILMQVFMEGKAEYAPGKKLIDGLVAVIGLGLFTFVGISLITNPDQLDLAHLARLTVLPAWLTLFSLPFVYLLGLYVAYEQAFIRIDFFATDEADARRAKQAMIKRFHFRARRIGEFSGRWQKQLVEAAADGEPQQVMREFQRERERPADCSEAWIGSRAA
jgi:hypothetical protein